MTNPQYSFAFSKKLIETLAKHFHEVQRDEQSGWKRIALELNDFDGVPLQCWQVLRTYFKRSLVFKLSKTRFTDDQELIDRLQYPYLRKVYSITVSFVDKAPNGKENAEDNVLFTKSVLDGTYDPAVVAVYKRYACKGRRVSVNINVNDPRYKLPADQRELLMQIEQRRARKHKPVRQLEAGVWHDAASGSRVGGTEGDPVVIEQVASPVQNTNGSVRRLLDDESLDINTQEYEQMMKDSLEPQLPSLPKRRRFTIASTVDSEEEQDELDATSVVDLTSSDSECQNSIVFVDPNDQFSNSLINFTHDPLQMSNAQLEANSQESQDGGEKDTVTSEPLFTPSSGESAKNNSEHPVGLEQTVSREPAGPVEIAGDIGLPASSDAVPVVQSSVEFTSSSAKTLMVDIADNAAITDEHEVPVQLHNKAPSIVEERSTAPVSSEIIRAEDLVAKSQPPTLILQEEPSPAGESRPPVTVKEESLDDPVARSAKMVGNPAVPNGSGRGELAVPSTNAGFVARAAAEVASSNAKSKTGTIATEQRTLAAEQVSTKTVEEKRPTVVEVAPPPIRNTEDLFNRSSGTVTDGPAGDPAAVQSEEPPVPSSNAENVLHAPSVEIVQPQPEKAAEMTGTAKKVQPAVVKVEPPDSAKPKMTISASLLAVFDKLDAMFDGYHATITVSGTRSASTFDAVHVIQSSSAKSAIAEKAAGNSEKSQPDVARPVSEHTGGSEDMSQQLHSKTPEKTSSIEQGSQVGSSKIIREAKNQPPNVISQGEPSTAEGSRPTVDVALPVTADPDARPAEVLGAVENGSVSGSTDAEHIVPPVVECATANQIQPGVVRPVNEHAVGPVGVPAVQSSSDRENVLQQLNKKTPENTSSVEHSKIIREDDRVAKSQPPNLIPQEEPSTAEVSRPTVDVASPPTKGPPNRSSTEVVHGVPPAVEIILPKSAELAPTAKQIQPAVVKAEPSEKVKTASLSSLSASIDKYIALYIDSDSDSDSPTPSVANSGTKGGSCSPDAGENATSSTKDPQINSGPISTEQRATGQPNVVKPVNVPSSSGRVDVPQQLHNKAPEKSSSFEQGSQVGSSKIVGEKELAGGSRPSADPNAQPAEILAVLNGSVSGSTDTEHEVPPALEIVQPQQNKTGKITGITSEMAATAKQLQPSVVRPVNEHAAGPGSNPAVQSSSDRENETLHLHKKTPENTSSVEHSKIIREDDRVTKSKSPNMIPQGEPSTAEGSRPTVDVASPPSKGPPNRSSTEVVHGVPPVVEIVRPKSAELAPTAKQIQPAVVKAEPSENVKTASMSSLSASIDKYLALYGDFDSDSDSDSPAPSAANSGTKVGPCCSDTVLVVPSTGQTSEKAATVDQIQPSVVGPINEHTQGPEGNPTVQSNSDRENVPQQPHKKTPEKTSCAGQEAKARSSKIIREENLVAKSLQEEPSTAEGSRPTVDSTLPQTEDPPARPAEAVGPVVLPAIEIARPQQNKTGQIPENVAVKSASAKQIQTSVDAGETATSSAKDPQINSGPISTEQRGNPPVQSSPGSENVIQTSVEIGEPQPQGYTVRSTTEATSVSEESLPNNLAEDQSQASTSGGIVPGAFRWEEDDSVQDDSRDSLKSNPVRPTISRIEFRRWLAHHQTLEPVIRRHLTLYATLRHRWPQLFHRTTADIFSTVNSLNDAITATLFPVLKPTNVVRVLQMRTMVDPLVIRISYGLTPQELERAQQAANRSHRPVLVERKWNIVLESSESVDGGGGSPAPKRIKISETGSNSYTVQSNSPVAICLSDSEDSPSVRLPVRKRRQQRVRTELYK